MPHVSLPLLARFWAFLGFHIFILRVLRVLCDSSYWRLLCVLRALRDPSCTLSARPLRFVVAERHRRPHPPRRRLRQPHHRPQVLQLALGHVARNGPALELGGGEFLLRL